MADGELTMFGKAYDTVGSTNKNLVLLTRGDLKIRWGNKYIDLIKNGKINVDVDIIKEVGDVNEIVKDGIYLILKEEGNEVWVSVGGTNINIFGEISDNYVAFVKELDIDPENKLRALLNIGFYYESMEKAKEKQIKQGLVYILDLNKLYYVDNGEFMEYTVTQMSEIANPLKLKNITIDGEGEQIIGTSGLYFDIVNDLYIGLADDTITLFKKLVTKDTISSEDFLSGQSGFSIYNDDLNYIGEFDVIKVRKSIIYDEILDVTYEQLRSLMEGNQLYPRKLYRIIDFFNEWDYYLYDLTSELGARSVVIYEDPSHIQFYFPIVVTAASKGTLEKEGYFCENKHWIVQYDPTFNHLLCEAEIETSDGGTKMTPIYARGRITKLTDEYGNSANYDFKHRLFKGTLSSDDRKTWLYTYNKVRTETTTNAEEALSWEFIHNNWDASSDGNITNNIVNLPEPELENYTLNGETVQKVKLSDDYFIFDCATNFPSGNNIKYSKGYFNVTGPFYNNTFELLISTDEDEVVFSLDFHDNVFKGVKDCTLDAPMQFNTFDKNLVNVAFKCTTMLNNHFTGIIYTNEDKESYPIEATNFNNNTINNINMSAITCYGCDIANNSIHNINGCDIDNSNLTDITMKDITGENNYSNNPTDEIDDSSSGSGNNPGGNDPVNPGGDTPGGDTPVNPGGGDSIEYYGLTWYTIAPASPGADYTLYSISLNDKVYYTWYPNSVTFNGVTYYLTLPANPGSNYTLVTVDQHHVNYYAWVPLDSGCDGCEVGSRFVNGAAGYGGPAPGEGFSTALTIGQYSPADGCSGFPSFSIQKPTSEVVSDEVISAIRDAWKNVTFSFNTNALDEDGHARREDYFVVASNIPANPTNAAIHFYLVPSCNSNDKISFNLAAGSGSSTPTTSDADVDEYLNTFKGSVLTSVEDLEYSLLSTAMDKLDTFESRVMSDNMFVDEAYTLPSGNSSDTRDARRGWYMALLLTALHPLKNSVANNDILAKAMSKWGISQSTDTNSLDVSTYEAKYKGLLQGSIAFSCLFSDSSFVNSFKSCIAALGTSYSHRGDDGDLGKTSRAYAPAGQNFFPYPPTNNRYATTGLMKRDENAFLLGKDTLRSTSRGTTAIEDIKIDLTYFLNILLAATGKNNKSGNAYTFMHDTQWDGKRTVNNIKDTPSFWRSRPAWENEDYTVDGNNTNPKSGTYDLNFGNTAINNRPAGRSNTTSYPSGHTGYFWNTAYCFAAVGGLSDSAIVNLFKRAYQYSESRVVVGAHWLMCVEMGRIAAACSFATLCGNTKFIEELLAAQG